MPQDTQSVVPAVSAKNLSKAFGKHRVLDSLNLDVVPGMTVGLLGANGAGERIAVGANGCTQPGRRLLPDRAPEAAASLPRSGR